MQTDSYIHRYTDTFTLNVLAIQVKKYQGIMDSWYYVQYCKGRGLYIYTLKMSVTIVYIDGCTSSRDLVGKYCWTTS